MKAAGWVQSLLILSVVVSASASTGVFCLDYYVELGRVIHEVTFPKQNLTSGQLARQCVAHCSGDPECTAAWSVSGVTTAAPACKLLSHTAEDVEALFQPAPGLTYPIVQPNFTAKPGSREKSLSWLCLKKQADWDDLGAAAYRRVRPGAADPGWCAYATNAAGYNLDVNWQGSSSLAACADSCDSSRQCTFWVGRPGHCWPKYSALAGADGWTSASRPTWLDETVQPNAAVVCFKQLQDWRELGQQLSPNAASVQYNGLLYTLFPERVNHSEADAACRRLPDGRLAQLDTQAASNAVGKALLPTLPMQYSAQVAWVGGQGILDDATASLMSGDINQVEATTADAAAAAAAGGTTPTWQQGNGTPVNSSLYTHPSEHYLQWRASDSSFKEYVPVRGKPVCVAALGVPPPPVAGSQPRGQASPGLYLFTCRRPTAFICQSSSLPAILSSQLGRAIPKADLLRLAGSQDEGSSSQSKQRLALAILLPVLAALVLGAASCVCASQLRWLLRSLSMQRKRAMGLPSKGSITVAVTDIQGYTKLSEAHPQAMGQALLLHNQAIRDAAYTNAGHVLAQEGDSFIVGFADPLDAAVFALQVQHSLQQLHTPPELTYDDPGALTAGSRVQQNGNGSRCVSISSRPSSCDTDTQISPSYLHSHRPGSGSLDVTEGVVAPRHGSNSLLQQPWRSSLHALLCPWSVTLIGSSGTTQVVSVASGDLPQLQTPSKCSGPAGTPSAAAFRRRPSNLSSWLSSSAAGGVLRALSPHGKAGQQQGLFKGLRVRVGLATGAIRRGEAVETTMAYSMARVISDCGSGGQILTDEATMQAVRSHLHLLGAVTAAGLDYRRLDTGRRRAAAASCLQSLRCSAQSGGNGHRTSARDAVVLDMGQYETALCMLPSVGAAAGLLHTPAVLGSSLEQSLSVQHSVPTLQEDECVIEVPQPTKSVRSHSLQQDGPWSRPLSVLRRSLSVSLSGVSSVSARVLRATASGRTRVSDASCSSRACACACAQVRLYQLLAPELLGRAVVFGATLKLPDSWRCIDPPYFSAPGLCDVACQGDSAPDAGQPSRANGCSNGSASRPARLPTSAAPSGSNSLAALRALSLNAPLPTAADLSAPSLSPAVRFPPVAFVFVAVEGAERLQQQQFPGIGQLHTLLARLMLEACLLLRGYLVKTYESELKFFATFQTPAQAVEWCLLVQEAALLLPYDNDLLAHHGFTIKRDTQGRVVYRGPRLKMGVAAGAPTCIIPDHKGRADYLGPCCNQAARICDAAAHGGQVALEQGVASTVLQHWRTQRSCEESQEDAAAAPATPDDTADQGMRPDVPTAGGACSSSARQQSQGVCQDSVAVQVTVQQLGSFLFKGCAKSLQIVHVSPQHLAGRAYPAAPPRGGKGVRLAHAEGVVEVATVCLPRCVTGLEVFV